MPRTFSIGSPLGGVTACFALPNETVSIITTEFLTSEDGNEFTSRLEGISNHLAEGFTGTQLSQVDNFLAFIDSDGTVTSYCNELSIRMKVRIKQDMKAYDLVSRDDLADVEEMVPVTDDRVPVQFPEHSGIVFVFSQGWRKGLFYDFRPCNGIAGFPLADLHKLFGRFLARIMFQELYTVTESQWAMLLGWGWFPFVGLTHEHRTSLIGLAATDRDPTPFVEPWCHKFAEGMSDRLASWRRSALFSDHMRFIEAAAERYAAGDPVSCLGIILPRIEGVLRLVLLDREPTANPTQKLMPGKLVERTHAQSLLLPARFEKYLREVYFRPFDVTTGDVKLSRHSHTHGVSRVEDYDFVGASLAFLTLDQIYYYLPH